jgi:hypothetical protein
MSETHKITSRMPRHDYDAIGKLNISRLKELKRSPLHFRHMLDNPKQSDPLTLGNATHIAVLEPERYVTEFVTWQRLSENGNPCPRRGQYWDAFLMENPGRKVLTVEQNALANAIAKSVRFNETAQPFLDSGDPEVSLEWLLPPELGGRPAKGRVDWVTGVRGRTHIVGLKTARDCRHFQFSKQAANLGYHMAWAYYFDAWKAIVSEEPELIEIVAEVDPPHAVAVYRIPPEIILQGREEYHECVKILAECEQSDEWPGPVVGVEDLSLPSWAYRQEGDDLTDLGLE